MRNGFNLGSFKSKILLWVESDLFNRFAPLHSYKNYRFFLLYLILFNCDLYKYDLNLKLSYCLCSTFRFWTGWILYDWFRNWIKLDRRSHLTPKFLWLVFEQVMGQMFIEGLISDNQCYYYNHIWMGIDSFHLEKYFKSDLIQFPSWKCYHFYIRKSGTIHHPPNSIF